MYMGHFFAPGTDDIQSSSAKKNNVKWPCHGPAYWRTDDIQSRLMTSSPGPGHYTQSLDVSTKQVAISCITYLFIIYFVLGGVGILV